MKDAIKAVSAVAITMAFLLAFGWGLVKAGQFAVDAWGEAWQYNSEHYSQMAKR